MSIQRNASDSRSRFVIYDDGCGSADSGISPQKDAAFPVSHPFPMAMEVRRSAGHNRAVQVGCGQVELNYEGIPLYSALTAEVAEAEAEEATGWPASDGVFANELTRQPYRLAGRPSERRR